MKKIVIASVTLILLAGIWIVKAKSALPVSRTYKTSKPVKENTKNQSRKMLKNIHIEDEDAFTTYIYAHNIRLSTEGGQLKITDMNSNTVKNVFGNPTFEYTDLAEWYDYYDDNVLTYRYANGNLRFIDGKLLAIDAEDEGFSFEFTMSDGTTEIMAVGTEAEILQQLFTSSWENAAPLYTPQGIISNVTVYLKSDDGTKTDATLTFVLTGDVNSGQSLTIHKILIEN